MVRRTRAGRQRRLSTTLTSPARLLGGLARCRTPSFSTTAFLFGLVLVPTLSLVRPLTCHPAVRPSGSFVYVQVGALKSDRLAPIALHRRGLRVGRFGSNAFDLVGVRGSVSSGGKGAFQARNQDSERWWLHVECDDFWGSRLDPTAPCSAEQHDLVPTIFVRSSANTASHNILWTD
jgi:hypothetical protein